MLILKDILRYNLIKAFVIIFIVLFATFILLIVSHLAYLINIGIFSAYISVVNNFITINASLIALSIPFIMKNIEKEKDEESEKETLKFVLKRLEEYLELPTKSWKVS